MVQCKYLQVGHFLCSDLLVPLHDRRIFSAVDVRKKEKKGIEWDKKEKRKRGWFPTSCNHEQVGLLRFANNE